MAYLEFATGDKTGVWTLGSHEGRGKSAGPLALGVYIGREARRTGIWLVTLRDRIRSSREEVDETWDKSEPTFPAEEESWVEGGTTLWEDEGDADEQARV
jgi:hypothetical protein